MARQILVFGDSNSVGVQPVPVGGKQVLHADADRWPNVMLGALGDGFAVQNASFSGRSTGASAQARPWRRNGIEIMPRVLDQAVPPDLVILMLGTNDLMARMKMDADAIADAVGTLVDRVRGAFEEAAILVLSPVPVIATGMFEERLSGAEVRQAQLPYALRQMTQEKGVSFLDLAPYAAVSAVDGLHLEAEAHHQIGAVVAAKVETLFERQEKRR